VYGKALAGQIDVAAAHFEREITSLSHPAL